MSHCDFGSFGLFAGNCPRGILEALQFCNTIGT
jgi:hypothetical protein